MNSINQYLKEHLDLNLKERIMVYSGPVLGIIAPVTYVRYVGFGDSGGDPKREALYWATSAMVAIPLVITGGLMGAVFGATAAVLHKAKRREIERGKEDLETKVTNGN